MKPFPAGGVQAMILERKGDRTYARLSADCGGIPTEKNLQKIVARDMKDMLDKATIEGLARGLGVTVTSVVLACATSMGLRVRPADEDVLELPGAGSLPAPAKGALISMSRELQNAYAGEWDHAINKGNAEINPGKSEPST